ncbi:hypothetical protein CAPTEDRAFT_92873 [Capitella teleta]|uniref:G-protein coupled receptors family 1 profile domain-containing protein n=1 Tax=Capitella teleta TaxID=283909 RepID=R7VAX1_CAPTE|nr:hypothetical protein CAPTEDRAFT_92873 [Capitella teleta]|eukprot:ELU15662.1 hypothetical protein CAPTEDRAFT_92873 [Capitella teleta]
MVILMAGVPGNLLTILAYFKNEQLRNPTNILICSQSIGDLFTCLTGPLFVTLNYTEAGLELIQSGKYLCLVSLALLFIALQSSIVNILALSTERFIAVYFSLNYYNWVTEMSVKRAVVAIWSVVITINCLPMLGWEEWRPEVHCMSNKVYPQAFFQGFFIIPSLICLFICTLENFAIAVTAIRRQRSLGVVAVTENVEQQSDEANIKSRNQFKVTKMLLLVVGCFYTTWLPWIIFNSLLFGMPSPWKVKGVPSSVLIASEYSKALLVSNAIVNPFIYGWKNLHFRDAYYKLLGIRRNRVEPSP